MIVPRRRLLVVVLFTAVPLLALAFSGTAWSGFASALFGLLVLLALADAFLPDSVLEQLEIKSAPVVRMTKGKESVLSLYLQSHLNCRRTLSFGLSLPDSILSRQCVQSLEHLSPGICEMQWNGTPRVRGEFPLRSIYLESASRLGLWSRRTSRKLELVIRVYPNLFQEKKVMAALFLNAAGTGIHTRRQLGQGREFEKLRYYLPGDSYGDIHWKASAKRNSLVTKEFRTEQTQEIYVVLDASRLSARRAESGEEQTIVERFITASLITCLAAEKQGDLFGVLSFSDKVDAFIRAKSGREHYHCCRDALYHLHPKSVSPDFDELCTFIRLKLRKRALLVFLVNLDDPVISENFIKSIELISRRHLVLVGMIQDRHIEPMFSMEKLHDTNQLYDNLASHLRWNELRKVKRILLRRGVRFSLYPSEGLCLGLVTQYMHIKQRQLL
ncbi:MAG: DUF58 domain-containing protein [Acidobacteria bacterium]|nr:MAG: DUF58 domain-containing protein [Acidobacteriota bacterium]